MPFMDWSEEISVGIDSIDNEHKNLLLLINTLYDAVQSGKGADVMSRILDELITYTVTHFTHEEEYMVATIYPAYHEHKDEHDALRKQLMEFHARSTQSITAAMSQELLVFMKCWFYVHVLACDRAFGPHLRAKGIT